MNGGEGSARRSSRGPAGGAPRRPRRAGCGSAPLTRSFTVLRAPAGRGLLDQAVDGRVLARDDDLSRAVVVRRPHAVDRERRAPRRPQSSRPRTAAIAPGRLARGLGHRHAALAHERDRVAGADRVGGCERRVLADRVPDDEVRARSRSSRPRADTAIDVATSAGCWSSVRVSSSREPSKHSWATSKPTASDASSYTARASGNSSAIAGPCPRPASPGPESRMRSSSHSYSYALRTSTSGTPSPR